MKERRMTASLLMYAAPSPGDDLLFTMAENKAL